MKTLTIKDLFFFFLLMYVHFLLDVWGLIGKNTAKIRPLEPKWLLNPGSATYQSCDLEPVT